MLDRLPFTIPEFLRTVWVSEEARAYWEPKIRAISQAWPRVERASLTLRPGVLQSIAPADLAETQAECLRAGVPMTIVGIEGQGAEAYGNAAVPYRPGAPFSHRVYFGPDPLTFLAAWQGGDNAAIGAALGFPPCCVRFFDHFWRELGWRDLTYPAMTGLSAKNLTDNNVLLKALGVRPVFHLPCSLACDASRQIGEHIYDLMHDLGLQTEAAWSRELRSMPMSWTSLHGVAILVTPIFKLVYASDPLPTKVTLRVLSDHYPEHSARGTDFPFLTTTPMRFARTHLNGFTTRDFMDTAHRFVLEGLPVGLSGHILDLGCGDGALLRAIHARYPETDLHGVEQQRGLSEYDVADLFEWTWPREYRLVLLAVQRLTEVSHRKASALLEDIADHAEQLFLYSYDGWRPEVDALVAEHFSTSTHRSNIALRFESVLCEPS